LSDPWKATEYTLAANQLKSDWKKKQYTWNEEKSEATKKDDKSFIKEVTEAWFDLGDSTTKAIKTVSNLITSDSATSIPLLPFEMKAFKISA
jgi:hypothetical protein